ncbi:MAG: hypothetical protein E6Q59_08590 [Nitrosomonas sp.]|nr:MAG: hypothetical protein E6Q59_08590 [Nitrosomonas sp.]
MKQKNIYRLSDNYLRFFIKYIEPNLPKIEKNAYEEIALSSLPGWETMMGFQVENLLLKNRPLLLKSLGIEAVELVADNPFIQYQTTRYKGCQIDYLIQAHSKNLYFCEFKFKRRELGLEVIESTKEKEQRLSAPRGFAKIPVLFHLGDVTQAVFDERYFYRIIDITSYLD